MASFYSKDEIEKYKELIDCVFSDPYYASRLRQQYIQDYRKLSICEITIIEYVLKIGFLGIASEYKSHEEYNPILYQTNEELNETALNLLFGELIFGMLSDPKFEGIKRRQYQYFDSTEKETFVDNGLISIGDKRVIIQELQKIVQQSDPQKLKNILTNRFLEAKAVTILYPGKNPFLNFQAFNTNISAAEVLELPSQYVKKMI